MQGAVHRRDTIFVNYPTWLSKTSATLYGTTPDSSLETSFTLIATDGELSDTLDVIVLVEEQTSVNDQSILTESYSLYPNYPNPFNPNTKIEFRIANFGFVSLKVYDVLGNEIATLVNNELPEGEYEIEFDAPGLPNGIYFYQLKAGDFIQTKKMVLLK